jgi:hypothetical protein
VLVVGVLVVVGLKVVVVGEGHPHSKQASSVVTLQVSDVIDLAQKVYNKPESSDVATKLSAVPKQLI